MYLNTPPHLLALNSVGPRSLFFRLAEGRAAQAACTFPPANALPVSSGWILHSARSSRGNLPAVPSRHVLRAAPQVLWARYASLSLILCRAADSTRFVLLEDHSHWDKLHCACLAPPSPAFVWPRRIILSNKFLYILSTGKLLYDDYWSFIKWSIAFFFGSLFLKSYSLL